MRIKRLALAALSVRKRHSGSSVMNPAAEAGKALRNWTLLQES